MATAVGTYATLADVKLRLGMGTAANSDDALLQDLCDQVNGWIERETGRVIAPFAGTYTFDGVDVDGTLNVRMGIVSITSLEIAEQTGGAFSTIPATDYFLSPSPANREPGWPAFHVRLSDVPAASNPYPYYPSGYQNIRLVGTFGWAAIPDEITDIALTTTVRAWHGRMAGQSDIVGTDDYGRPLVSRYVSGRDRATLSKFKFKLAP